MLVNEYYNLFSEAVTRRCSFKMVFLKIPQNSQGLLFKEVAGFSL